MITLPSPFELLRGARLRYFATLVHSQLDGLWATLALDDDWRGLLEADMVWMWQQLKSSSRLPHPKEAYEQWLFTIQRLLHVRQFHCDAVPLLWTLTHGARPDGFCEAPPGEDQPVFGCLLCQKKCLNAAGEAAHMYRVHGQVARVRFLFDTTSCSACLKEFHTAQKLKAHLYYSARCRRTLQSRNLNCVPVPGAGSVLDQSHTEQHDRLLPPLQCEGPHQPPCRPRADQGVDDALYCYLVEIFTEQQDCLVITAGLRDYTNLHPITWTTWTSTLRFFEQTLSVADEQVLGLDLCTVRMILQKLGHQQTWPFLCGGKVQQHVKDLKNLEAECEALQQHIEVDYKPVVPRSFGRFRLILHAFSGRRRLGDVQYYLDQYAAKNHAFTVQVISMGIVNDARLGDATNPETCNFWRSAIRQKHVIGFIGGPPCETWSLARGKGQEEKEAHSCRPRVIRDIDSLWGFDSVTLRELAQLFVGNELLCFSLLAFIELIHVDGFAIIEHPAEPQADPRAASIWRLPILLALRALPNVQLIRFAQGLMGAASPKPTGLLALNLPELLVTLHANRVRTELPMQQSIGKDQFGRWRTTALKEYSPALCKCLASAMFQAIQVTPVEPACQEPLDEELVKYRSMVITDLGDVAGADFAGYTPYWR